MFRKRCDYELPEIVDSEQAMNYIYAGIKYFLVHKWIKTLIILLLLLGGALYTLIDVYQNITKIKQHYERLK